MDSQVSAPAMASASEGSAIAKKPQTAVVKKVVDADDDDNENASVPGTAIAKRSVREAKKEVTSRNTVAARKLTDSDVDGESETSDSRVSEAGRSDLSGSRQRSNSRTIASGRPGSASDLDVREAKPTVYTRKNDTFTPLETRTAIANQARADLFVSIHANSSHDPDARGVETYYLNFTSSPEALDVAARENAVSEKSIYELQDLVKKIALKEKIEESREFAGDVQASLHSGLAVKSPAIRDRGVKKAPFIVLIGANMPSILAEISFVSNPTDEHRLATSEYRERIAESLYRGIAKYVNGLSGVKVASKMDKAAGQ